MPKSHEQTPEYYSEACANSAMLKPGSVGPSSDRTKLIAAEMLINQLPIIYVE
jgi:hypothetical protein